MRISRTARKALVEAAVALVVTVIAIIGDEVAGLGIDQLTVVGGVATVWATQQARRIGRDVLSRFETPE